MPKKKPTKPVKSSKPPSKPGSVVRGKPAADLLPRGYAAFLEGLKARIRTAQVKATLAINSGLIALYWGIGRDVVERQRTEGWGRSVIERLAHDLQAAFPGVSGFSPSNVWRMRGFYLAYTADVQILARPVRELDGAVPSKSAATPKPLR